MWDLPPPGLEPVSPALAGGFLTTVPPGKPNKEDFKTELRAPLRAMPPTTIVAVPRPPVQPVMAAKSLSIVLACPVQPGPSGGSAEGFRDRKIGKCLGEAQR